MRIKVGDTVEVIAGNYKGERGTVSRILRENNRVVVDGINMVKKHQKPQQGGRSQVQGGIIEFEAPIHASNVMVVCPDTDHPSRVGYRRDEDGKQVRYSKQGDAEL